MPKYRVHGRISRPVHLGQYEAESAEDAIHKAMQDNCDKVHTIAFDIDEVYDVEASEA